jgi:hypothetical protein
VGVHSSMEPSRTAMADETVHTVTRPDSKRKNPASRLEAAGVLQ